MTYPAAVRDHLEPGALAAYAIELARPQLGERTEFSPLEEQVMALARTDRLGSLEAPGRVERLFKRAFGLVPEQRALADPRLETLRRAFVVARHRHHLPDGQAAELAGAGFSVAQIRIIEARAIAA